MINLTDRSDKESIILARSYPKQKVQLHSKSSQKVYLVAEGFERKALQILQKTSQLVGKYASKINDLIEDKIGEEADIPDFVNPYPQEHIIALALAYPFTKKPTLENIMKHYLISKRQAGKIKFEIENCFPSFPAAKRIWEVVQENSREQNEKFSHYSQ